MKKIFLIIPALFCCTVFSFACEICGCGVGNFYMGLLPNFKSKFVGVRYSYLHYYTQLADDHSQFSNDYYRTTEVWSGWNIGSKWQLMAFVPYHFNKKISDDGIKESSGLGDISLLVNYSLLHSRKVQTNNTAVEQQLWLGAGIKFATGKYKIDLTDPDTNIGDANSQSGTGSTNLLLNALYTISIQKFGVNTSLNYSVNTINADEYRFGNRFTCNSLVYYRLRLGGVTVSPNVGVLYQTSAINHYQHEVVEQTGGYLFNAAGGAEISLNKITVGINTQEPLSQNFASGQTVSKARTVLHVSFAL